MKDKKIQWHPGFVAVHISNEISRFFRGYNIIEYKSPEDHLDIDKFCKSIAYASLYKSYGETVDERKANDITVSIIREAYPRELFKYFREHGYAMTNPSKRIYHIKGNTLFPIQVVVTKKLDEGTHTWLKALSENLRKEDIENLLDNVRHLTESSEQEMADSVLEVSLKANIQILRLPLLKTMTFLKKRQRNIFELSINCSPKISGSEIKCSTGERLA